MCIRDSFTVVQHPSHRGAERQKAHKADTAQKKAVSKAFADGFADDLLVICGIGLGYGGHEQYGNRVGQCAREKNKRQGHSRQYAVNTQGITDRMAVNLQLCRNTGGFNGLELSLIHIFRVRRQWCRLPRMESC